MYISKIPVRTFQVAVILINLATIIFLSPDNASPVFDVCPGNFTNNTPAGEASRVVGWMVSASDNSGQVSITSTHSINDSFPVDTTQVTYQAVDASGNSAECVFYIVIAGKFDLICSC